MYFISEISSVLCWLREFGPTPRNGVSKKWSSIRFRYRSNDELRTKRNKCQRGLDMQYASKRRLRVKSSLGGPQILWVRGEKVAYSCLQQAGDHNFSSSFSRNLGSTFQAIPVLSLPYLHFHHLFKWWFNFCFQARAFQGLKDVRNELALKARPLFEVVWMKRASLRARGRASQWVSLKVVLGTMALVWYQPLEKRTQILVIWGMVAVSAPSGNRNRTPVWLFLHWTAGWVDDETTRRKTTQVWAKKFQLSSVQWGKFPSELMGCLYLREIQNIYSISTAIHSLSGVEVVGDDAAGLESHLDALGLEDPGVQFNGHF